MESELYSDNSAVASPESAPPSLIRSLKSKISDFYHKYEKYSELAIFCVGFLWDSLTMTRVDNMIDNVILLFYLILIATMIIFTLQRQTGTLPPKWIQKYERYSLYAMQFCFGGLFSSYVIFYFKSASWTRTQFFFLLLVFLLIANEFLHHRMKNAELLAILYSFCLFSFFAFFLPVVLASINEQIFLLAGLLSLIISLSVFSIAMHVPREGWQRRMAPIASCIGVTVIVVNVLYFANLIPPVPLALKEASIYHSVIKTKAGYEVKYVPPSFWRFWQKSDSPFYYEPGDRVYCFTAIFAPRKVRIPVRHVWYRKTKDGWVKTDKELGFEITGGSEGGYHGFTFKRNVAPGKWRVAVETLRGQPLGYVNFDIEASPIPPPQLQTRLIPF
jgi:hypothetical protein